MLGPEREDEKATSKAGSGQAAKRCAGRQTTSPRVPRARGCPRKVPGMFKAVGLTPPAILLRLRPARERFLQLRLWLRSGSAWSPSQLACVALGCRCERPARALQPPPRASGPTGSWRAGPAPRPLRVAFPHGCGGFPRLGSLGLCIASHVCRTSRSRLSADLGVQDNLPPLGRLVPCPVLESGGGEQLG